MPQMDLSSSWPPSLLPKKHIFKYRTIPASKD